MNGDSYSRGSRQSSGRDYVPRGEDRARDRDDSRRDRDRHHDRERDRPRRRSRSPGQRGSGRNGYEGDSYSSSRGYREREREDRYSGRDRRGGDRDWDRDGGRYDRHDRRDRRDYDSRREDRRGGGRRDDFASQGRRDPSPPRKPKEPTPDLTDITPVMERRRRMTQWDIKPPGYDQITSEQAKLSGMFPLPGAPRQQQMDQSRLDAFLQAPGNSASKTALQASGARQAKRMLAYNIPESLSDDQVKDFINLNMRGLSIISGSDPCVAAQVSKDKTFALLDFRSAEDATAAYVLDGLVMGGSHENGSNGDATGAGLRIERPKDYITPSKGEDANMGNNGQNPNNVADSAFKFCLHRLPLFIEEEQAKELLSSFGGLKSFVLVRDSSTGESRGVAFGEYQDGDAVTDPAIEAINGMELGDNKLKMFKACAGTTQVDSEMSVNNMSKLARTADKESKNGRVLCLHNMVTVEELMDNDEYEEICEDVKGECEKFGEVLDMKIPRPSGGSKQSDGVGKIYVKFDSADGASQALKTLAGRKFAERTVIASFFSEENFDVGAW